MPPCAAKKEQIDAEEKAEREEAAENARKEADAQKEREASKQVETSKLEVAAGDQSTTPLDTKTYAKVEPREPVQQGSPLLTACWAQQLRPTRAACCPQRLTSRILAEYVCACRICPLFQANVERLMVLSFSSKPFWS